jgi:hypothetical protein
LRLPPVRADAFGFLQVTLHAGTPHGEFLYQVRPALDGWQVGIVDGVDQPPVHGDLMIDPATVVLLAFVSTQRLRSLAERALQHL